MIDDVLSLIKSQHKDAESNLEKVQIMLSKQRLFGSELITIINKTIKDANATESVDERINLLVSGLSSINVLLNTDLKNMEDLISKYSTELKLLERLSDDVDLVIDKKKDEEEQAVPEEKD